MRHDRQTVARDNRSELLLQKKGRMVYLGRTGTWLFSVILAGQTSGCLTPEEPPSSAFAGAAFVLTDAKEAAGVPPLPSPVKCDIVVATTGSDSNSGTIGSPFLTPHKAASIVMPGQTICLRDGVYATTPTSGALTSGPVKLDKEASANARIVFRSYPGELAILDGSQGGQDEDLIQARGQYIDIVGLELQNAKKFAINLYKWIDPGEKYRPGGRYIRIVGNTIHDSHKGAVFPGAGSKNMTFENNIVFHNVRMNQNHAVTQPAAGWPSAVNLTKEGDVVLGNFIFENWGEGLGVYGTGHYVADNRLHDNFSADIYVSNAQKTTVERNFVYSLDLVEYQRYYHPFDGNCGSTPCAHAAAYGIQLANDSTKSIQLSGIRVVNNVVVGKRRAGLQLSAWNGSGPITLQKSVIAHNTIACAAAESTFGIRGPVDISAGLARIVDNIFHQMRADRPTARVGTTLPATFDANNWFGGTGGFSTISSPADVLTPPQFVNEMGTNPGDFRLMSTSGNIDHGLSVAGVGNDFFLTGRPQGSAPDIGAHEFLNATP